LAALQRRQKHQAGGEDNIDMKGVVTTAGSEYLVEEWSARGK